LFQSFKPFKPFQPFPEGKRIERFELFERLGVNPSVWTDFGAEFRMPSGEKKGVVDERAEEVFGGIQA
jgi:hypothetical protein